jgi:adenylosuccinate synthase
MDHHRHKICVYGGQFGSEGKGSASESIIKKFKKSNPNAMVVVAGENSPNSGHTNSIVKTRNIPAASVFADVVLMGPDSVIDMDVLREDIANIVNLRDGKFFTVYIHQNASVVRPMDKSCESSLVERISSTGSGSGYSRYAKQFGRCNEAVIGNHGYTDGVIFSSGYSMAVAVDHIGWQNLVNRYRDEFWVFECSQGLLLDVNFGYFPYVTSRSTIPAVAIARNGLSSLPWSYNGVFRTFPIRTGGPSGPTGGKELAWGIGDLIGINPEIATVTKRTRRIFDFNEEDFLRSVFLQDPANFMFTHLDYIGVDPGDYDGFMKWLRSKVYDIPSVIKHRVYLSNSTGDFVLHRDRV